VTYFLGPMSTAQSGVL